MQQITRNNCAYKVGPSRPHCFAIEFEPLFFGISPFQLSQEQSELVVGAVNVAIPTLVNGV
jgi:hypothetical protein